MWRRRSSAATLTHSSIRVARRRFSEKLFGDLEAGLESAAHAPVLDVGSADFGAVDTAEQPRVFEVVEQQNPALFRDALLSGANRFDFERGGTRTLRLA